MSDCKRLGGVGFRSGDGFSPGARRVAVDGGLHRAGLGGKCIHPNVVTGVVLDGRLSSEAGEAGSGVEEVVDVVEQPGACEGAAGITNRAAVVSPARRKNRRPCTAKMPPPPRKHLAAERRIARGVGSGGSANGTVGVKHGCLVFGVVAPGAGVGEERGRAAAGLGS